ncbi:MAG TPA: hypothetical protein VE288_10540 [Rubrobacteraceae bacterium]|nr:hypothetical protein [Rubrobacteraceae bacterium]
MSIGHLFEGCAAGIGLSDQAAASIVGVGSTPNQSFTTQPLDGTGYVAVGDHQPAGDHAHT